MMRATWTRRRFLQVGSGALAAAVLAACGSASNATPTPAAATGAGQAPTAAGGAAPAATGTSAPNVNKGATVKLKYAGLDSTDYQNAFVKVLNAYKQTHPGFDVEYDLVPYAQMYPKIQTLTASKTPVDIVMVDGPYVANYAFNNIIVPLDKYFTKDYVTKSFAPAMVDASTYQEKFYAAPMQDSASVMWYNKTITDKAGIKPPTERAKGWTMDEALDAWKEVNNPPTVYGVRWGQAGTNWYGQDYENGLFRRSAGTKDSPAYKGIADDGITISGYFDHPVAVKGHQFLQDLYQKHKVSAVEAIPDIWFNGKAVFYIAPDIIIGQYKRLFPNGSFEYAASPIPYFKDGTRVCHNDSFHFSIGTYAQHPDEAADFIKFMTGAEGAKLVYDTLKQLPANQDVLKALPEYQKLPLSLVAEQYKESAVTRIITPGYGEFNSLSIEFYQNVQTGQGGGVQDLATSMAKRCDGLLQKYKGWKK
ncbi:MAG TPA: sugar ABC transporter substrate-binding protein [Thermomicrobiales bacterium]|nr:sugar ABC transporter substrate-binding protein [Thermomicrobiales bacterium]